MSRDKANFPPKSVSVSVRGVLFEVQMPAIVKTSKKRAAAPHSGGPSSKKPHLGKSASTKAASNPRRSQRITVPAQPDNDESEDDEVEDEHEDEDQWVDEEDGLDHDDTAMDVDPKPAKDPNGECNIIHVDPLQF